MVTESVLIEMLKLLAILLGLTLCSCHSHGNKKNPRATTLPGQGDDSILGFLGESTEGTQINIHQEKHLREERERTPNSDADEALTELLSEHILTNTNVKNGNSKSSKFHGGLASTMSHRHFMTPGTKENEQSSILQLDKLLEYSHDTGEIPLDISSRRPDIFPTSSVVINSLSSVLFQGTPRVSRRSITEEFNAVSLSSGFLEPSKDEKQFVIATPHIEFSVYRRKLKQRSSVEDASRVKVSDDLQENLSVTHFSTPTDKLSMRSWTHNRQTSHIVTNYRGSTSSERLSSASISSVGNRLSKQPSGASSVVLSSHLVSRSAGVQDPLLTATDSRRKHRGHQSSTEIMTISDPMQQVVLSSLFADLITSTLPYVSSSPHMASMTSSPDDITSVTSSPVDITSVTSSLVDMASLTSSAAYMTSVTSSPFDIMSVMSLSVDISSVRPPSDDMTSLPSHLSLISSFASVSRPSSIAPLISTTTLVTSAIPSSSVVCQSSVQATPALSTLHSAQSQSSNVTRILDRSLPLSTGTSTTTSLNTSRIPMLSSTTSITTPLLISTSPGGRPLSATAGPVSLYLPSLASTTVDIKPTSPQPLASSQSLLNAPGIASHGSTKLQTSNAYHTQTTMSASSVDTMTIRITSAAAMTTRATSDATMATRAASSAAMTTIATSAAVMTTIATSAAVMTTRITSADAKTTRGTSVAFMATRIKSADAMITSDASSAVMAAKAISAVTITTRATSSAAMTTRATSDAAMTTKAASSAAMTTRATSAAAMTTRATPAMTTRTTLTNAAFWDSTLLLNQNVTVLISTTYSHSEPTTSVDSPPSNAQSTVKASKSTHCLSSSSDTASRAMNSLLTPGVLDLSTKLNTQHIKTTKLLTTTDTLHSSVQSTELSPSLLQTSTSGLNDVQGTMTPSDGMSRSAVSPSSSKPASVPRHEGTSSKLLMAYSVVPSPSRTVFPSSTAIGEGNLSVSTDSSNAPTGHNTEGADQVILFVIVATVPAVLVVLLVVVLFVIIKRYKGKQSRQPIYSIKVEYPDESRLHSRPRWRNSRLDLTINGIHIDLEFPNTSSDKRHSARISGAPNLTEAQMKELQILSMECKENLEWINEVLEREMETPVCPASARVYNGELLVCTKQRDSVYSGYSEKEKENFEVSEKLIRRASLKRDSHSPMALKRWRKTGKEYPQGVYSGCLTDDDVQIQSTAVYDAALSALKRPNITDDARMTSYHKELDTQDMNTKQSDTLYSPVKDSYHPPILIQDGMELKEIIQTEMKPSTRKNTESQANKTTSPATRQILQDGLRLHDPNNDQDTFGASYHGRRGLDPRNLPCPTQRKGPKMRFETL